MFVINIHENSRCRNLDSQGLPCSASKLLSYNQTYHHQCTPTKIIKKTRCHLSIQDNSFEKFIPKIHIYQDMKENNDTTSTEFLFSNTVLVRPSKTIKLLKVILYLNDKVDEVNCFGNKNRKFIRIPYCLHALLSRSSSFKFALSF